LAKALPGQATPRHGLAALPSQGRCGHGPDNCGVRSDQARELQQVEPSETPFLDRTTLDSIRERCKWAVCIILDQQTVNVRRNQRWRIATKLIKQQLLPMVDSKT
jgi:hypothetical protein